MEKLTGTQGKMKVKQLDKGDLAFRIFITVVLLGITIVCFYVFFIAGELQAMLGMVFAPLGIFVLWVSYFIMRRYQ